MKLFLIVVAGVLLALSGRAQAGAVTVTQAAPIQKLDSDRHPSGVSMAAVGAKFSLVKADGDNLILTDASGSEYEIAVGATDYTPPAPAAAASNPAASTPATNVAGGGSTQPPASTETNTTQSPPSPATNAAAAPAAPAFPMATAPVAGASKDGDNDKVKQLNDAIGMPLLSATPFWQDDVDAVAQRLKWPQESKTVNEESYRLYATSGEAQIFGASAYSLALYGKQGKPTYISIIFSNAGDFPGAQKIHDANDTATIDKVKQDLAAAVKKDAETIAAALTPILGEPTVSLFGNSSSNRDEVHRWDWNGVSILLNSHQGEYASVKIMPSEAADHFGTVEVTDRDALRDILAKRVVKRDNGDVIISELPMVDQGPKGYCVPATWERYLRYVDVPADLYVLAIMGDSGLGGGTDINQMEAGVSDYVSAYHRRIETYDGPLDVSHVAKYIDQGLPLMWTCWVVDPVETLTNKETHDRKTVTDWTAYTKSLVDQDKTLGSSFQAQDPGHSNGHMRMIIGYNTATDEIAISDSWGSTMAERWMYVGTAKRISQGDLAYLTW